MNTNDPKPRVSISPYVPKGTMYRLAFPGYPKTDVFHDEEDALLWIARPESWAAPARPVPREGTAP